MKESEQSFVQFTHAMGWGHHKYGDVRYCMYCHKPLPKSELKPDYLLAPVFTWVECKNSNATGRWTWRDDIGPGGKRELQRKFLTENGGYLYILLGKGRPVRDKMTWIIPWGDWLQKIEPKLLELNIASIAYFSTSRTVGAKDIIEFAPYQLVWEKGKGWVIPKGHPFFIRYLEKLKAELEKYGE